MSGIGYLFFVFLLLLVLSVWVAFTLTLKILREQVHPTKLASELLPTEKIPCIGNAILATEGLCFFIRRILIGHIFFLMGAFFPGVPWWIGIGGLLTVGAHMFLLAMNKRHQQIAVQQSEELSDREKDSLERYIVVTYESA